jgi:hypothetical protein
MASPRAADAKFAKLARHVASDRRNAVDFVKQGAKRLRRDP